jgi:putative tributyrin esterase
MAACYVVLPEAASAPLPVVYMLHGLSDDHTAWQRRTSIERFADGIGLMVVMLDGARSFYVDAANGAGNYEKHVLETGDFIDRHFRTAGGPRGRAIGGLSMGGYGALKLGLKYPERFASVAAHSSAVDMVRLRRDNTNWPELPAIYGAQVAAGEDCFRLAARPGPKPALRIDCGTEDSLLDDNRRFHARLTELRVPHDYLEFPGGHDWAYWDRHIEAALRFHREVFDGSAPQAAKAP